MKLKGGSVKHDHKQQLFCVSKLNELKIMQQRKKRRAPESSHTEELKKRMNIRQQLSKITPSRKDEDENEGGGYTQSPET